MPRKRRTRGGESPIAEEDSSELFNLTKTMRTMLIETESLLLKREQLLDQKEQLLEQLQSTSDVTANQLTHPQSTHFQSFVSFKDVSSALPGFSDKDEYGIRNWIRDLEGVSELLHWSPIEKLLYAKRLLIGSAKLAVRSKPSLTSWEDLKSFLIDEFAENINSAEIHRRLTARKQMRNEPS